VEEVVTNPDRSVREILAALLYAVSGWARRSADALDPGPRDDAYDPSLYNPPFTEPLDD
jgi:hypothetical protein